MEDDRLIDCGGKVVGGGGSICDIQSNNTSTGITTVLYYLNLWIYHRSLLVVINALTDRPLNPQQHCHN